MPGFDCHSSGFLWRLELQRQMYESGAARCPCSGPRVAEGDSQILAGSLAWRVQHDVRCLAIVRHTRRCQA